MHASLSIRQSAIKTYVDTLLAGEMVVLMDLHWTAPGATEATKQLPMPDADHTPTFWTQVAQAYNYSQDVVFEIFNEPFPGKAPQGAATAEWECWYYGGANCTADMGVDYTAAGMSQVGLVRSLVGPESGKKKLVSWLVG